MITVPTTRASPVCERRGNEEEMKRNVQAAHVYKGREREKGAKFGHVYMKSAKFVGF